MASECPYCGYIADTLHQEVFHMNTAHPEKVEERLRFAGMHYEADKYVSEWKIEHGT